MLAATGFQVFVTAVMDCYHAISLRDGDLILKGESVQVWRSSSINRNCVA